MIFPGPVPEERQKSSRKNYILYCFVNGFSYMCLGETVLILLAVKINSPDYIISSLGAMIYVGFLLLPLGKLRCSKIGAAMSLADFWVARNIAALIVALSAVLAALGWRITAMVLLLLGAFLFYGFRAAGVVLSQPLLGSITNRNNQARLIGVSNGYFYVSSLLALLTISFVFHWHSSIWVLVGVVIAGSMCGIGASTFLRRVDETDALRDSSQKPILPELHGAWSNSIFVRQLCVGFYINLAAVMVIPISVAALKRGYGVSDTDALLYTLLQLAFSALMSFLCGRLNAWIGPRKSMLWGYSSLLLAGLLWFPAGPQIENWRIWLIFLLLGGSLVVLNNSVGNYYLQTIEQKKQVAYSVIVAIVTSVGAGLVGMLLAGYLLWFFVDANAPETGTVLRGYRHYFGTAVLTLLPGLFFILRLKPLSEEQRRKINRIQVEH